MVDASEYQFLDKFKIKFVPSQYFSFKYIHYIPHFDVCYFSLSLQRTYGYYMVVKRFTVVHRSSSIRISFTQ